jgi:hypothetical protein
VRSSASGIASFRLPDLNAPREAACGEKIEMTGRLRQASASPTLPSESWESTAQLWFDVVNNRDQVTKASTFEKHRYVMPLSRTFRAMHNPQTCILNADKKLVDERRATQQQIATLGLL